MKKYKLIIVFLLIIGLTYNPSISTTIKTETKSYSAPKGDIVSTRELALLAAIAYENVPDDRIYQLSSAEINKDNDCFDAKGNFKKNDCFYKVMGTETVRLAKNNKEVLRYIEGMSERKFKSIVSKVTASLHEDGEQYYFLNFAHAEELEKSGWKIYDYLSQSKESALKSLAQKLFKDDDISVEGVFDVITFKKGSNYVIAYRGTDYPDLLEWAQDLAYAINGQHAEALMAYTYAQQIYDEISANDKNAKIYVTGHSLGAYLAQIGGAAIIDKEAGKTYTNGDVKNQKQYNSLEEYRADYYKGTPSKLQQVAYFNGMGIDGLAFANDFSIQTQNALVYLSTYDKNGNINSTNRNVNYSNNIKSSGRLVLYSMDGDPISSIGFHFGEIYKLETAADAITNHRYQHSYNTDVELLQVGEHLPGLLSGLNSLMNKLTGTKLAQGLTSAFKQLITSDHITNSTNFNYLPKYVMNSIEAETGRAVTNYGLASLLENLNTDLQNYTSVHGMTNLFDHFNANHETDSFACIIDTGKGTINKENTTLTISSTGLTCDNSTGVCHTTKAYNDKKIKFDHLTVTGNYQGDNIMLTAAIDSACAKRYIWEYSNDGLSWLPIGTTIDNKIIIPNSIFENTVNGIPQVGTKTVQFRVKVAYGDTFTELKSTFPQNTTQIKYERRTTYSANPTISEGLIVTPTTTDIANKQKSEPITKSVTLITVTAPECHFEPNQVSAKLKRTLGIYKGQDTTVNLVCTGVHSGIKSTVTAKQFKTEDVGLIPSITFDGIASSKQEQHKLTVTIKVRAKRVPTSLTPKVTFNGTVIDSLGHNKEVSATVTYDIKKK